MRYDSRFSRSGIWGGFGRLRRIRRKLKGELRLAPEDVVLDIGCDKGDLVSYLRPFCREIVGIDVNEEIVRDSAVRGLSVMDARKTDFPDGHFTKIVSSHTIEHVPELPALFREIDRVLRPGGRVVLYYPWELFRGMGTMRNAWLFFRNPFKGYRIHINHLSHRRIQELIRGTNLRIAKKKFYFDPQPGYITVLAKES